MRFTGSSLEDALVTKPGENWGYPANCQATVLEINNRKEHENGENYFPVLAPHELLAFPRRNLFRQQPCKTVQQLSATGQQTHGLISPINFYRAATPLRLFSQDPNKTNPYADPPWTDRLLDPDHLLPVCHRHWLRA